MDEKVFPVRFICDQYFILDLLKDKSLAIRILLKLSNIHKNSKHYPMGHNLIPDFCFKESIKGKAIRGPGLVGAFHPEPWPEFVKHELDPLSKMLKYAINTATKKPYKIIILTSKEKEREYESNPHYSNNSVKSVIKLFSGEEALKIIDIVLNISE